jgi:hypothetical protein
MTVKPTIFQKIYCGYLLTSLRSQFRYRVCTVFWENRLVCGVTRYARPTGFFLYGVFIRLRSDLGIPSVERSPA